MDKENEKRIEPIEAVPLVGPDSKATSRCWRPSAAALRLDISRSSVYALIASGELPAFRIAGKSIRISEAQIEEFIARMTVEHAVVRPDHKGDE